uniref:Uncharacterized protein n=1 Tax=Klebsiella pneumoniae TaxID=573 RepID=A0A2P1BPE4_KLEPN|nr:hypothetical protein [Klebsiella pneumoniae]
MQCYLRRAGLINDRAHPPGKKMTSSVTVPGLRGQYRSHGARQYILANGLI